MGSRAVLPLHQNWSPKFVRSLAEEARSKAKENWQKRWLYSASRDLATADALDVLASFLEGGHNVHVLDTKWLDGK